MNIHMKSFKFITVVLLTACLCACSQELLSETQSEWPHDGKEEQHELSVATDAHKDLVLITNRSGPMFTSHAITQAGCYEVLMHSDGTGNILYSDFETKQKIFLSSQISSKYADESDTSFLPSVIGGASPMTDGNSLYIYKSGSKSLYDYYGQDGKVQISKMNLDGSSKKTLYLNANQQIVRTSSIVSDATYLYCILLSTMPDTTSNYDLVKLDIDNREMQVVQSFGSTDQVFIIGAYSQGLVLKKVSFPSNQSLESAKSYVPQHELLTFNLETNKIISLKRWENNDVTSLCLNEDSVYFVSHGAQVIHSLSLINGEENDPLLLSLPHELAGYEMELGLDTFDNRLLLRFSSSDNEYQFSFDLKTQQLQPFTLMQGQQFLTILGENSDYFVVLSGEKMISFDDTAPDGSLFTNQQNVPCIALIKKSDLWNNIPNYINIDDSTIFS